MEKEKSKYWQPRYNVFIKAGFSEREAIIAADSDFHLGNPSVKRLLKRRENIIAVYMKVEQWTREMTIEHISNPRSTNCLESCLRQIRIDNWKAMCDFDPNLQECYPEFVGV